MSDVIVYDRVGAFRYVGFVDEAWQTWPAEAEGWQRRRLCTAPAETDGYYELPTRNAHLALVLSGAPHDD